MSYVLEQAMELWVWVAIAVPWIILAVVIAAVLLCYFNYVMKGNDSTCLIYNLVRSNYLFSIKMQPRLQCKLHIIMDECIHALCILNYIVVSTLCKSNL